MVEPMDAKMLHEHACGAAPGHTGHDRTQSTQSSGPPQGNCGWVATRLQKRIFQSLHPVCGSAGTRVTGAIPSKLLTKLLGYLVKALTLAAIGTFLLTFS